MKTHIKRVLSFMLIALVVISIAIPTFAADQSSISENGITIQTSLIDGSLQKGQKKTFDVWARDSSGTKIPCTATLNGQAVKVNWNDTDKTSFTLVFTTEGVNTIAVTASSNGKTATAIFHITYKKAENGEIIGYATWCVEAFTIGRGYIVEPIKVPIREGENSAAALVGADAQIKYSKGTSSADSILGKAGFNFESTGKVASGFYLAAIKSGSKSLNIPDDVTAQVPAILANALKEESTWLDGSDGADILSEFTFAQGSGWMYSVNNVFPNVGLSDTYLSDGDVVRVQFTLWYGSDIGGSSAMCGGSSTGFYNTSNKSKLTDLVSQINSEDKEKFLSNPSIHVAYNNAYKVLQQVDASQSAVDSVYNTLYGAMNPAPTPTPAPTPAPNVPNTNPVSVKNEATNITIDAPTGVLPANTQVSVNPVTNHALANYQLVETALNKVAEKFTAYQITLESGNTVIEPNGKVKVSLPIPEGYDSARLSVARILDDGTTKLYDVTVQGDTLTFETDHFSLYAVIEKAGASSSATPSNTSTISTSSGKTNFNFETNPNTGDNVPVYVVFFIAGISFLIYFALCYIKKQRD